MFVSFGGKSGEACCIHVRYIRCAFFPSHFLALFCSQLWLDHPRKECNRSFIGSNKLTMVSLSHSNIILHLIYGFLYNLIYCLLSSDSFRQHFHFFSILLIETLKNLRRRKFPPNLCIPVYRNRRNGVVFAFVCLPNSFFSIQTTLVYDSLL